MSKPDYTQLIREQYTVLQAEHLELRRQHDLLLASSGGPSGSNSTSFPARLLELAKSLQNNAKFADCQFATRGSGSGSDAEKSLPAHRFVLATRSRLWQNLEMSAVLEVAPEDFQIFETKIYRWIYEDRIELGADAENEEGLMRICEMAAKMKLEQLMDCTIAQLSSRLNPSNCIRIFEFAEVAKFEKLAEICTQMVSANWPHFSPAHFAQLSAPIIYRLISKNTENVLKNVCDIGREDVLFLFFIQNSENLRELLNATWHDSSSCALETCLRDLPRLIGIGAQLIEKGADVDLVIGEDDAENLLMRAIRRDSLEAVRFLKEHGANLMYQKPISKSTAAHILAQTSANFKNTAEILEILKSSEVQPDSQDRTPLQIAVLSQNFEFCRAILRAPKFAAANFASRDEHTALSLAVLEAKNLRIAELLILNGADLKALRIQGTPILNILLLEEENLELIKLLLDSGVDFEDYDRKSGKSAIHLAVQNGLTQILTHIFGATKKSRNYTWRRDSEGKTALDLAVEKRDLKAVQILIEAGAPINEPDSENLTLLAKSILAKDDEMAVFLIDHGAKAQEQNGNLEKSYLELSCESGLLETVRSLISTGLQITPNLLELALLGQYFEVANLLVQFGCPLDSTILHKFLDANDQPAAIFLIRAGCDVSSSTQSTDVEPAIHIAVGWSMLDVLRELVARDPTQLVAQDANGRTAAHLAVREQNLEAMQILLESPDCDFIAIRDRFGQTILSQAMIARDHKIAAKIVERQPHAAAQTNGNGENLLHSAIRQNDFEAVLFLLAVARIDVGRAVQDGTGKTPLHLAAVVQNEMIIRNLILAAENVNSQSTDGCTPLHDALKARKTAQARILLENRADPAIRDEYGENAFLCAVRSGDLECVKLIDQAEEICGNLKFERNKIGMTCLHLCALLTPEKGANKNASMEICELLLRNFAEIDKNVAGFIDAQDADGNTALMIAYSLGNAAVCRSLLRRKASMGIKNNGDVNVFTYETATKQLLLGLLESLECEPRWSDSDTCDCGLRFSLTQRKHHCRHCGRHVCAKCSETTMPIAKYGEEKRVRVCDVCSHVISGKR
ncbi:unnamed protein product [Caenorhabditis angaria]|uniref:FYVE-type domain-containing protein n=1 Tax=Caenorhabditis angaria TaxID=860376 RepID=A0A9P1I592_9PELO|nr:unnamed protein product [Caenorhabditis angaria]